MAWKVWPHALAPVPGIHMLFGVLQLSSFPGKCRGWENHMKHPQDWRSRVVCSGQSSDWCWSQWRRCQANGYTLKCQNLRKPLSILCPRFAQNKPEDIWCTGRLLAQRVCCRLLQDLHVCQKAGETWHTSFLPPFSFSLSSSLSLPPSSLPLLVPPSLSSSLSYGSCFSYFFK